MSSNFQIANLALAKRSDYAYHFVEFDGVKVLVIIDLDQGGMTVTNNVENVVMAIADEVGEDILNQPIVYRDSQGIFDGIDGAQLYRYPFYPIGAKDRDAAVRQAIEMFLRN